ncbi:LysR family transcriptional regulator [Novosphingobium sp. YJ-S2-02]|uniref:LysR family transcriptional regulator n=1 Tax=Novosphingobium aureum TaxID=2792964 RepID=A0A931HAB7_9SPHN|nr:LysR family transcriptional regulator [Novosphingobium aureum]MBH0112084.1 LysR family transcriptional regulator [Novosphingobium aureum]
MALLQLRSFVEVYRQRSLSGAARSLGLTQPAISQHIAALEAAIGHPLFVRHAKGVTPTIVAEEMASGIGDSLDMAEAVLARARARSADLTGIVRIMGQADFLAEIVVPGLLPLVRRGMQIRFTAADRAQMAAAVLAGECDLAISAYPLDDRRVRSEVVHEEGLHAVAAPEVVARIMAAPDLAHALQNEPVLAFNLEQQLIGAWFEANGLAREPLTSAVVGQDLRCLQGLAMRGFGWCVLPSYLCDAHLAAGDLVEITAPRETPVNRYHMIWTPRSLREPRVALVHAEIRTMFRELPDGRG